MSNTETPAAHLARLKVQHPAWAIWKSSAADEYVAAPPPGVRQTLVIEANLPALEARILEIERRHDS